MLMNDRIQVLVLRYKGQRYRSTMYHHPSDRRTSLLANLVDLLFDPIRSYNAQADPVCRA